MIIKLKSISPPFLSLQQIRKRLIDKSYQDFYPAHKHEGFTNHKVIENFFKVYI